MTLEDQFEQARKLYPGTTRGLPTEFDNFRKHKDWKDILPLLIPAIEAQIAWRKSAKNGEFREAWKHFRTWINQSWWEMEPPVAETEQDNKTRLYPIKGKFCHKRGCGMPAVWRSGGDYPHHACLDHAPAKIREKYI